MRRLLFLCKLVLSSVIGRLQKHLLGSNTFGIISHTDNGLFATNPEDMGVGQVLRKIGSYGTEEVERVFKYAGKNDNVLIIGAHIGALVVPIAKRCRSVVAIEANPDTFALLKINLSLNSINNVRAYNIAASDKAEMIEFVSSRNNSGGAKRMPKVRAFEYFYDSPETISVQAFALDEYLKGEEFSLVFMDIEGSEYFALNGMPNILRNARTLFIEYLPHHLRNVSGVSPKKFLGLIEPHFETLLIPSKNVQVSKSNFLSTLQSMFDNEQGDDGLVFAK
jgi:FkbM family methyltransferase